ncbi:unnamed protein product [Dovyalis caffra]|uniref:Uncharacterized protein n=1 Tax=Dovyalis caffra TaxID=77055 RepID=A0AAV1QL38_9ROSI|nr:unnamed protein product [Dovyalis caffra]
MASSGLLLSTATFIIAVSLTRGIARRISRFRRDVVEYVARLTPRKKRNREAEIQALDCQKAGAARSQRASDCLYRPSQDKSRRITPPIVEVYPELCNYLTEIELTYFTSLLSHPTFFSLDEVS